MADGTSCSPSEPLDTAWRIYTVNAEWTRHGDAKIAALLTANGALLAGITTLVATVELSRAWSVATVASAGAGFLAAGWPLVPQLLVKNQRTSLLYFSHIAKNYATADAYAVAHAQLVADPAAMLVDLAGQTWSIATIARRKYVWTGFATIAFFCAAIAGSVTVSLRVWG